MIILALVILCILLVAFTWQSEKHNSSFYYTRRLMSIEKKEREENLQCLFRRLGVLQIIIAFVIICISAHTWHKLAEPMYSHEFEITAMNDNHEMYIVPRGFSCEGDTETRYYFMRPYNGGLKEGYIPAENTVIYQTDDVEPHIECYYKERISKEDHEFWAIWFVQFDWDDTDSYNKEYRVYIPTGSVIDTYNINLE
jgi:hypothetical protein